MIANDLHEADFGVEPALLALGRLDATLRHCPPAAERIFAARALRLLLIHALRCEGHAFTEGRFHTWFAGLSTLSDAPPRNGRPPRAVCEAILTELAHSSWPAMARTAEGFRPAFLAPRDHAGPGAHEDALAILSEARALVARCAPQGGRSVLAALGLFYREIAGSPLFAPLERDGPERPSTLFPPPSWALDMLFADCLHRQRTLPFAVPMPGLVRFDALRPSGSADGQALQVAALAAAAEALLEGVQHSGRFAARCGLALDHRSTSRAPAAFELLAGFGAMRSAQVEALVGASRLGVRGMLTALEHAGLAGRRTVSGAVLFEAADGGAGNPAIDGRENDTPFSAHALGEYEASLAAIDRLLDARAKPQSG